MKTNIPFEIITLEAASYHIIVSAKLNGHICDLLIDTGASQTVFDHELIPALPAEEQPEIHSSGISADKLSAKAGIINKFKLGKLKRKDWMVVLMDMTHVNSIYNRFTDKKLAGLLGSDFLLKHKAMINYGKKKMTLKI